MLDKVICCLEAIPERGLALVLAAIVVYCVTFAAVGVVADRNLERRVTIVEVLP